MRGVVNWGGLGIVVGDDDLVGVIRVGKSNVSDWVTAAKVLVPVIRSTSPAPYAKGAGSKFWTN